MDPPPLRNTPLGEGGTGEARRSRRVAFQPAALLYLEWLAV